MGSSSATVAGRAAVVAAVVSLAGLTAASATMAGGRPMSTAPARTEVATDAADGGSPTSTTSAPPATFVAVPAPDAEPAAVSVPSASPAATTPGNAPHRPSPVTSVPVRRPPPRPSRTSSAPDQPDTTPSPATPAKPASTARYGQDFPDPFVFRSGPYWYAMSTQRGWSKVPMIRSVDLVHWEDRGDGLAALPRWSRFGAAWAPAVLAVPGGFVLYYATTEDSTGLQCLSSAVAVLPDGPFVDTSDGPLVCQRDRGGSIDPSPFLDGDGRPWLAWKSEGTTDGEPTRLWSQPLTEDGRGLLGVPSELLSTSAPWEGPIIEAPSMVVRDGRYDLLYSGNRWETSSYATGHAVCDGPAGPCHRATPGPVAGPHPSEAGSGSAEVFRDVDGSLRVAYDAWDPVSVGYPDGLRRLRIGALRIGSDGTFAVEPLPA